MHNQRVFVSGGAGVIGRELVAMLVEKGAIVMVGDLEPIPGDFPKGVIYRRGDLNYITQQELDYFDPEVFIHLAATFERSAETYEHWEENFWHNLRLSNYLMTLMRNVPSLRRVVYASSYLIYSKELYNFDAPRAEPVSLHEDDPIYPRNLTGLAKLAHEVEIDFLAKFKSEKFSSICARIYRGYGKNSRDVISRWIRDLMADKTLSIYNPEGIFDYIFAGDSAEGLLRLAEVDDAGIVNLGTGRSRSVADVVDVLARSFPDMKKEYLSGEGKYEASQADITKLKSLIDWTPRRTLEDTIPEMIAYEREAKLRDELKPRNVLMTSISKKVPLISAVRMAVSKVSDGARVIGGDINEHCVGRNFVDAFWHMPRLSELSVETLVQYCKKADVGLIIPTRDGELQYFAEHKEVLNAQGIHVMVSDQSSIIACFDKLTFGQIPGIDAIPAYDRVEDINDSKIVVKERYGAGSISIGLDLSREEAVSHAKRLQNPIYQPYVSGQEVSVDAYIDRTGQIKGVVMRRRELVVDGESQVTTTFSDKALESRFREILSELKLYGHVILQAMISSTNGVKVIECNPRFGGASTLSVHMGLDSFYWAYLESMHESLEPYQFLRGRKEVTQVRHAQDTYL
ncbi:MAG: NAD-dependent epimerase/dehydratase family protein [Bacteroidota bacterium]